MTRQRDLADWYKSRIHEFKILFSERMKRIQTDRKYFQIIIVDRDWVSRIYKESSKPNIKTKQCKTIQLEFGQKTFSPDRIYRWQIFS